MDEERFSKLEDKTSSIKEDLIELKADVKHTNTIMDAHIAGDQKIISELQPLFDSMPQFCEMVEDHVYKKRNQKEKKNNRVIRNLKLRTVSLWVGIPATLVGTVTGMMKLLGVF